MQPFVPSDQRDLILNGHARALANECVGELVCVCVFEALSMSTLH